jgi:ribosomal protein L37E
MGLTISDLAAVLFSMKCRNCGQEQTVSTDECVACGIIFAKWKARQERDL